MDISIDERLLVERHAEITTRSNCLTLNWFRQYATIDVEGRVVGYLAEDVHIALRRGQRTVGLRHAHQYLHAATVGPHEGGKRHRQHLHGLLHRRLLLLLHQVGHVEPHQTVEADNLQMAVLTLHHLNRGVDTGHRRPLLVALAVAKHRNMMAQSANVLTLRIPLDTFQEPLHSLYRQVEYPFLVNPYY